jgi:hypothetical protein
VEALLRLAIVARDEAALEAAIEHAGVARCLPCNVQQLLGQRRRAALAVGGAQVQVGQLALEKRGSTERMLCASHSMATPCWLLMRSSSARSCA